MTKTKAGISLILNCLTATITAFIIVLLFFIDDPVINNGWESERELFTAALLGGTDGEAEFEETDYGFANPDYPADHLGIDSAYLAADVMNILDNDSHTEDCTTMNQPQKNKKNTQSGGFNMSM